METELQSEAMWLCIEEEGHTSRLLQRKCGIKYESQIESHKNRYIKFQALICQWAGIFFQGRNSMLIVPEWVPVRFYVIILPNNSRKPARTYHFYWFPNIYNTLLWLWLFLAFITIHEQSSICTTTPIFKMKKFKCSVIVIYPVK